MIDQYVYVPCSLLSSLPFNLNPANSIIASREDEALAIGAGLHLAGKSPLVMMQNSGFANSLNTLGSLLVAYGLRVPILITMRGGNTDQNPTQIPVGQATTKLCEALGVPTHRYDDPIEVVHFANDSPSLQSWSSGPLAILYGPDHD